MSERPRIIMDERERGTIRDAIHTLDCELIIDTLDYGDYILSPNIAIERKRGDDLTSSLFDARFFTQLFKLKAIFKQPILLIESPEKMFDRPFIQESSVYGAILYAAYKLNIPIIPTVDEQNTASMIYTLAKKAQLVEGKPEPNAAKYYSARTDDITKDDQIYFLEGLLDVGVQRAELLLNFFGTPYNVIHAILDSAIKYSKKGIPTDIEGFLVHVKGIGPKFVEMNQELLKTKFHQGNK